jgi:hypothetical protein
MALDALVPFLASIGAVLLVVVVAVVAVWALTRRVE